MDTFIEVLFLTITATLITLFVPACFAFWIQWIFDGGEALNDGWSRFFVSTAVFYLILVPVYFAARLIKGI